MLTRITLSNGKVLFRNISGGGGATVAAVGDMRACRLSTALLLAALIAGPAQGTLPPVLPVSPLLAGAQLRCRGPTPGIRLPSLSMAALWGKPSASNRTVTLVTQLSMDR